MPLKPRNMLHNRLRGHLCNTCIHPFTVLPHLEPGRRPDMVHNMLRVSANSPAAVAAPRGPASRRRLECLFARA